MRVWLWRVAAFLMLLFLLDRGLYAVLARGFRQTEVGETGGMVNRVRQVRADVVVLGSSRAWRHYDPDILQAELQASVYNGGCDGQGVHYVRGVVDLLLRDYKPGLLIIDTDPVFLVEALKMRERIVVLAPFMDESDVIRDMIYERGPLERLKYLSASFRFNSKPLAILKNWGVQDLSSNGFRPLDKVMSPAAADLSAGSPSEQNDPDAIKSAVQTVLDTVRAAKSAGTEVVLVTSPKCRHDFREDPAHVGMFEQISQLAAQHRVPYLRITQDTTPEFHDPALFADAMHLNRRGAAVFTGVVARRLAGIGIDAAFVHARTRGNGHVTSRPGVADVGGPREGSRVQ